MAEGHGTRHEFLHAERTVGSAGHPRHGERSAYALHSQRNELVGSFRQDRQRHEGSRGCQRRGILHQIHAVAHVHSERGQGKRKVALRFGAVGCHTGSPRVHDGARPHPNGAGRTADYARTRDIRRVLRQGSPVRNRQLALMKGGGASAPPPSSCLCS